MLEVKKDRLIEINKQIRKCIAYGNWSYKKELESEQRELLLEVKDIESKRGETIGK